MRCSALHRTKCKSEHERSAVSQWDRMKAIRKKRCKQNRKCFHYVENLVNRSLFALNACCFGYWLFICNKNNAFLSYTYSTSTNTKSFIFFVILTTVKSFLFLSKNKEAKKSNLACTILNYGEKLRKLTTEGNDENSSSQLFHTYILLKWWIFMFLHMIMIKQ